MTVSQYTECFLITTKWSFETDTPKKEFEKITPIIQPYRNN